jgi:hypothetical protein
MEKSVATGKKAVSRRELHCSGCIAAVTCLACPLLWAQDAAPASTEVRLGQALDPLVRVEVQSSTLPRFEAQDSGFQAPRVDVSVFPGARSSALGAVFGMSGFAPRQPTPALGLQTLRPSVDVGLRFSQRVQSQQIDITAWRRMNFDDDAYTLVQMQGPVYGARVEMDLSSGRNSAFSFERGFIGLQLEGGARISIKRKDGRPMIYYRTSF